MDDWLWVYLNNWRTPMLETYLTPSGTLQVKNFRHILQQHPECVIAVVIPFPHHHLANYVRHSVGEEACWIEWFTWRKGVHCSGTLKRGCTSWTCCVLMSPFWFSISSCRYWASSRILCSKILLPRPKFRKVDKAKRLCLFHTSPLLENRPPTSEHADKLWLFL